MSIYIFLFSLAFHFSAFFLRGPFPFRDSLPTPTTPPRTTPDGTEHTKPEQKQPEPLPTSFHHSPPQPSPTRNRTTSQTHAQPEAWTTSGNTIPRKPGRRPDHARIASEHKPRPPTTPTTPRPPQIAPTRSGSPYRIQTAPGTLRPSSTDRPAHARTDAPGRTDTPGNPDPFRIIICSSSRCPDARTPCPDCIRPGSPDHFRLDALPGLSPRTNQTRNPGLHQPRTVSPQHSNN